MKEKRIFIGPCEIAGYYNNLTKGLKSIGVNSDFHTYENHPFDYGGESEPNYILYLIKCLNGLDKKKYRILIKIPSLLVIEVLKLIFFINCIRKYDVFIFGFGQTLTRFTSAELIIYRALKKKVICNLLHGSEARPPYADGTYQSKDGNYIPVIKKYRKITRRMRSNISAISRYCEVIIGAPYSSSQFVNKAFVNHFQLGLPISQSLDISLVEDKREVTSSTRILHSPSHPAVKGTKLIINAIDNLKSKGYDIDFIIIENMPNYRVIEEIKKCDFIIDQLYSDTPLAGFATEAAWYGKPAIVGGYGLEELKKYVNKNMWPPSKICHPDKIEETIGELIKDNDQQIKLGSEARDFVRAKWNIAEVALKYKRIIDNDIPVEWFIDPTEIVYLEGVGQNIQLTKKIVKNMINDYGVSSLQLKNRIDLQNAYIKFANEA